MRAYGTSTVRESLHDAAENAGLDFVVVDGRIGLHVRVGRRFGATAGVRPDSKRCLGWGQFASSWEVEASMRHPKGHLSIPSRSSTQSSLVTEIRKCRYQYRERAAFRYNNNLQLGSSSG